MCRYNHLILSLYKSIGNRINYRGCFSVYSFIDRSGDKSIERFPLFACGNCCSAMQFRGNANIKHTFICFFRLLPDLFAESKIIVYR